MASIDSYIDLNGLKLNILKDWRLNPVTTSVRTTLGGTLSSLNIGLVVFDTDLNQLFIWTGTDWELINIKNKIWLQTSSSSTWIFTHNLGYLPVIQVYDASNNELIGYNRSDNLANTVTTLTFGVALTGKIIAS